jgi:hypothetical protein
MEQQRSTREVLEDHLDLAKRGELDEDIRRNFSDDIVLLTTYGIYRGLDGLREKAKLLLEQLPGGQWTYDNVMVEGELGFLEWRGVGENGARIEDGADSYLIRDGRIVAMTIHYTVTPPESR